MDALPYYKWHWRDYRANRRVQRMPWQAKGLYRELLDEFWTEGSLPTSLADLADIAGCTAEEIGHWWPYIEACWEERGGRLYNAKMDEQRTAIDAARVAMIKGGKRGGKACNSATRAEAEQGEDKPAEATPKPTLSPPQAMPDIAEQSRAEQSRVSKTSSSHPGKPGLIAPVEAIYAAFPRKEARRQALKAIVNAHKRLVKGEQPQPQLLDREAWIFLLRAVQAYAKSPVGAQVDKSLIPHPATWFNGSRYLDDRAMWAQSRDGPAGEKKPHVFRDLTQVLQQQGAM